MITTETTAKPFLDENFLLESKTAQALFHEYARDLPIIDYHCHLPLAEIDQNRRYANLTQVWLNGDHYKWRAMRANGVDEFYITGKADDYVKFEKWAETTPYTMRNPLYHWTHLELRRYFGIHELLSPHSARAIYDEASALLRTPEYSARQLLRRMNVELVCTTDDPCDDLSAHRRLADEAFAVRVIPAFRPDKAIFIEKPDFSTYLERLSEAAGLAIDNYHDLLEALRRRVDYFHDRGARLADHGLEELYAADYDEKEVDRIFRRRIHGQEIFPGEAIVFKSALLLELGKLYHAKGWTQQFHLGALRNANTRKLRELGPDTGFDSIGDWSQAQGLARFLDRLDLENQLAKTVLYNLNPADNEIFAAMAGNFNDGRIPGKMQFGSAWWFLDQKNGMEKQINALSNLGLLSRFVGMLTDSRSFLSFPRHEYFRRILCNLFGRDVENGELPNDMEWIGKLIQDICYYNAKEYFDF
jgi:glucuronate isomerase